MLDTLDIDSSMLRCEILASLPHHLSEILARVVGSHIDLQNQLTNVFKASQSYRHLQPASSTSRRIRRISIDRFQQ